MSNTGQPSRKFTIFIVTPLLNSDNSFCESFLKYIFRQFFITYRVIDIRIKTVLITVQQDIECLVITLCIKGYQRFVSSICLLFHYVCF